MVEQSSDGFREVQQRRLRIVRLANGLVLTNYHIVEDIVGEVSTPQKDYAKEGFVAKTRAEEIKAPSLELNVLMSIEDVTSRVNGAVKAGATDAEAFAARRAEISAIEAESLKATGFRSDVVTLYQGGQYNLYRYKKYTDVRLVFVPEFQAAFFGGDPDNFNFPRFNIDMALVRVYENDQPVKPAHYFKWSTAGAKEGSLVFVTGHPGSTSRLEYRCPSRATTRHQHSDHHSFAGTSRSVCSRSTWRWVKSKLARPRTNSTAFRSFEGLSRTTAGLKDQFVDGPQDERGTGVAQVNRSQS